MQKVEFLTDFKMYELQRKVNDFIKNKSVINISFSIAPCGYEYIYGCCILYKD